MGRKIIFGAIVLLYGSSLLGTLSGHWGEPLRPELLAAQVLLLVLPIRTVRPGGIRLYSAMLYRVVSVPKEDGTRRRQVQFYPKNFEPWQDQDQTEDEKCSHKEDHL